MLDAAIAVLGDAGVRAVTHRAVDAAAELPDGSTSNLFRTRDALFEGIVERFVVRERENWERLTSAAPATTPLELAEHLADAARYATRESRRLTLARYTILAEAARQPALRQRLAATGQEVDAWFGASLRRAGSTDVDRDRHLLANYWTGLVLHELAIPDPAFDPAPRLAALLTALIPPP